MLPTTLQCAPVHVRLSDPIQRPAATHSSESSASRTTERRHRAAHLSAEQLYQASYTVLAARAPGQQYRICKPNGTRTYSKRFYDVVSRPKSGIHVDLNLLSHRSNHIRQRNDRRHRAIDGSSAVVADHERLRPEIDCHPRIIHAQDTLHDKRQPCGRDGRAHGLQRLWAEGVFKIHGIPDKPAVEMVDVHSDGEAAAVLRVLNLLEDEVGVVVTS